MTDVYQGREAAPGVDWWQAADGKWYHPGLNPERQASETVPPADGWWRAVDDVWYPPELHPEAETGNATTPGTQPDTAAHADEVESDQRSGELVDALPFVELGEPTPPGDLATLDATSTVESNGIDPRVNPSPALSMPVPPMPTSVALAVGLGNAKADLPAEVEAPSPTDEVMPAPMVKAVPAVGESEIATPDTPAPPGSTTPANPPSAIAAPAVDDGGTLSPSLTPADIAGPMFPTPTAAPVNPVGAGERMVLPDPGQLVDHASVPAAGAPLHLPPPTIGDVRHDLPAPAPNVMDSRAAEGAEFSPPPPVFSPADVVPTAPELVDDDGPDMSTFESSESDRSMERLDETSSSKRKLLMGAGLVALLAILGLFLFNRLSGGSTPDVVTPNVDAVEVAPVGVVGDGAAGPDAELTRLRTTGIQGDDAEVLNFANGVCAEVDKGSSWAEVLTYAASAQLAVTDPGMVAKVIATTCPSANGG